MMTRRSLRTLPLAVVAASSLLALVVAPALAHTSTPSDPAAIRISLLEANLTGSDAAEEAALEALIDSLEDQIEALEDQIEALEDQAGDVDETEVDEDLDEDETEDEDLDDESESDDEADDESDDEDDSDDD